MRYLIRAERRRVLTRRTFLIILSVITAFSIFKCVNNFQEYHRYDATGQLVLSAQDNLTESRKSEHTKVLDFKTLQDIVTAKEVNYLYHSNVMRLILASYPHLYVEDITANELKQFEKQYEMLRHSNIEASSFLTPNQMNYLHTKAAQLERPLQVGYAEGWKNLSNDLIDLAAIILVLLSALLIPIFVQTPKTSMKELCISTKYGKKEFMTAKIIAALEIGTLIYSSAVGILSVVTLIVFGANGYDLPIQSDIRYYFSTLNVTYLEQYSLNVVMGFAAMILLVALILIFTLIADQLLSTVVYICFMWIVMVTLPYNLASSFELTHWASNFFPYNMTNFSQYYRSHELYDVLGMQIPSVSFVMIVALMIALMLFVLTKVLGVHQYKKLER